MPIIYDPIKISGMGNFPSRTPFWRHTFVGGNLYMQNLLKNNIDSLNITADAEQFDSTIARTAYSLAEQSVELTTSAKYQDNQLQVDLYIKNLTGHKIPTGIPFRRMWIHLKVEQGAGNVVFESGDWDNIGKIINYNSDYEPHYDLIDSEDEVQVYEGVFVNTDQEVTYTLLRASEYVKDNRIPPQGFTTTHLSYDSTQISGNALYDTNFNLTETIEGSGGDSVKYVISNMQNTDYTVTVEICYQTVKPELVDHLRNINNGDINSFVDMYDAVPNIPFIMKQEVLDIVAGIEEENPVANKFYLEQNYPNPFNPSTTIKYQIPEAGIVSLKVYDVLSNEVVTLVNEFRHAGSYEVEFSAIGGSASGGNSYELPSGIYFYQLKFGEIIKTKKMILIK